MTRSLAELRLAARAWADGDPDPLTRAELTQLLEKGDVVSLEDRLNPLEFGTAGLRGAVGAGCGRMNLAVVLRTAHGIARYLLERAPAEAPVVIGFDARPTSRGFAEASAGVLLAAGFRVVAFSQPTPTPMCAFLGRVLAAPITIVVTASHNPRADNGYKVYGADAIQIVAPTDTEIAQHIATAPPARLVPRSLLSFADPAPAGLTLVSPAELDGYFAAISAAVPATGSVRDLPIVHSALHGVGSAPMLRTLADAGFTRVDVVAEQATPDGTFPTTPFPNPEEPGTLDLALAEGERRAAALLLVNDPDADRLAAVARLDGVLTVLDGNQVGALLADFALSRGSDGREGTAEARHQTGSSAPPRLVLSSLVSSPLVGLMAQARGAHHERTHTGFKWLWSAALELERQGVGRFCYAYEEALGYSVFSAVRDKDGLAAGRALAELAATLASRGATLFDRLYELYAVHGLWASGARNITLKGNDAPARISAGLDRLLVRRGSALGSDALVRVTDYRKDAGARPAWLGAAPLLELELESGSRAFVRPSGTEPKLKLYAHVRQNVTERAALASALTSARQLAAALLRDVEDALRL